MRTASFGIPHSTFSGSPNGIDRIDVPPNGTSHSGRRYVPNPKTDWLALPDFQEGHAYCTRNRQVARDVSTTGNNENLFAGELAAAALQGARFLSEQEYLPSAQYHTMLASKPTAGHVIGQRIAHRRTYLSWGLAPGCPGMFWIPTRLTDRYQRSCYYI